MTRSIRPVTAWGMAVALLIAMGVQLALTASRNSATFDEPAHIYAGYLQWTKGFYTLNPPLTRYLIAAPIAGMDLKEPPIRQAPIRMHEITGGRSFVFDNDADTILLRSRMAVVALGLLLAVVVFVAASRMFGTGAGLIALGLLAFDPTLLAHASVATTDVGQALLMFWAVYAFYRYVAQPSAGRMLVVALLVGLGMAAKSSAVLLFPMLGLLAVAELAWGARVGSDRAAATTGSGATRYVMLLATAGIVSFAGLWAFYGFHYIPPGGGVPLVPGMEQKLATVPSALEASVLRQIDRWHLLPQAYTYGFAHFLYEAKAFTTFLLGTTYPHAVWFFFPVAMLIKSSLTFLVLLPVAAWACASGRVRQRREMLYAAIPGVVYMLFSMAGGMNIGIRHILPVYVFMTVFIAGGTWALVNGGGDRAARDDGGAVSRPWLYAVVVLLVFQAVSVGRTFPAYIAYANEAWGGPSNVHKYLSDSSTDWGQQLKAVQSYLDERGIKECWFAYFGEAPLDANYYAIPCKSLPAAFSRLSGEPYDVPASVEGTVLISACSLSGFEFGPPPLAPYEAFKSLTPIDEIDYGVMVYRGRFDVPLASALSHVQRSGLRLRAKDATGALAEAREAERLAPDSARVLATVGQALEASGDTAAALPDFTQALAIAQATHPEFQAGLIASMRAKVAATAP